MKKFLCCLFVLLFCTACFVGCSSQKTIVVGATPSPHAEILNSKAVQDYVASKGYKLVVKVYQDYVTPNKALSDGGIDANYFQHVPYLETEIKEKGYDIAAACYVHNEPLNLYGKTPCSDFSGKTIYIINDASNVERAYKLLVSLGILTSYSVENFNAQYPVYTSAINARVQCIDAGLLHNKVDEGSFAVIPGNYALTAWDAETAMSYRLYGEDTSVAYPNIIACRKSDRNSEKISILLEALATKEVADYISKSYGPTVNYCYEDLRK